MRKFIFQRQFDTIDCGPSCLKMIAGYYGKHYSLEYLREACFLSKEGVSLLSINDAAEQMGFRTMMAHITVDMLMKDCPVPCIIHWNQNHFVVLYNVRKHLLSGKLYFVVADPAHGIVKVDKDTFLKAWVSNFEGKGTVLVLEPTPNFYSRQAVKDKHRGYGFLVRYLAPFKKYISQLVVGMAAASAIAIAFPFLTQLLIDEGVSNKNLSIVYLVLLSQLFLFAGSTAIDIIRSWLLVHINARISLNIISDFLIKLLKLPIRFFDTKAVGDLSQRINDHHRVENFLTGVVLTSVFSLINIVLFTVILAYFNWMIFVVFGAFSTLALGWVMLFQKKRRQLDYKRFVRNKENQDKLYEVITGMQEIKLYGSETPKRWEWEQLQVKSFKLNMRSLALEQYQHTGFIFINSLKNIIISFLAANQVINGHITLGALLSISYIVGQTNGPIEQAVAFIKAAQDARLSLDRLQEILSKKDEEDTGAVKGEQRPVPEHAAIRIADVSFQYEGPNSPYVLKDISLSIPRGKITAIVGTSGSGKTTLLKLLLGFYAPVKGSILVGDNDLQQLSPKVWRSHCGTVMQDGYIFYDTIARNIAVDGKEIDPARMERAVVTANLKGFIESLPLGYTTKIGASGTGLSGGQRQRILLARAVYKDPDYLFFDEATSSLDANNERVIMDNLQAFFKGKTVLVIAHRLSTVKNADQIIVLENGRIVENGSHEHLIKTKRQYFELVRNQLELGN
ncbi:peptidase domain-containing ABC transporter [Chitinophaga agrisoli]|uniref:peptidase domain-containing ABC transporter n=1 Tax=Chitinophaga agrisoli TaxID=2607653 RepID=UPI001FE7D39C|nr:peptidase domain-containing ABC transporter [Chitinophaga agrisoli]